jgi:hypothetical protein
VQVTVTCNEPDNLLYEFSAKMQYKGEDLPLNGGAGCGQVCGLQPLVYAALS